MVMQKKTIRNRVALAALVLILALVLAGCAGNPSGTQQIDVHMVDDAVAYNTVSVSATGTIEVMPDIAYVTAGVVTQDADAAQAQSDNSAAMNTLFDALKAAGLTEDDIETIGYSVYPMYDYNEDGNRYIYAYTATNTVRIVVRNLTRVGEIIDIAGQSGVNTNYSIQFALEDEDAYYNDALTKAMEEARGKADTLAAAGEFTIVGVLTVSEGGYSYYPMYETAALAEADYASETPISAGELEVSATVTVVYEIG